MPDRVDVAAFAAELPEVCECDSAASVVCELVSEFEGAAVAEADEGIGDELSLEGRIVDRALVLGAVVMDEGGSLLVGSSRSWRFPAPLTVRLQLTKRTTIDIAPTAQGPFMISISGLQGQVLRCPACRKTGG